MVNVKEAPRTATTIVVRSDTNNRITRSRDPYFSLMQRIFQTNESATRGQKFLIMVEERQNVGNPIRIDEWDMILKELAVHKSSFYSMRNKLLGAGLIKIKKREYRLSTDFAKDLRDMASWWMTAIIKTEDEEK